MIKFGVIFIILIFIFNLNLYPEEVSQIDKKNTTKTSSEPDLTKLNQTKLRFIFYPFGVGQYQNKHYLKAKFFLLTEVLAILTFFTSPLFTKNYSYVSKISAYSLGGLYALGVIDGMIFFKIGVSPVQPIIGQKFIGIKVAFNF